MRFRIEYKDYKTKEDNNVNLHLLDTFLNEHCIGKYHGDAFECIIPKFLNNFPYKRELKSKKLYENYAVIELKSGFQCSNTLDLQEFLQGFYQIVEGLSQVCSIPINNKIFNYEELLLEIKKAEASLPKTVEELTLYENNKNEIDDENHQKRIECLIQSYRDYPKDLNRNIMNIRIYPNFSNDQDLQPYKNIYAEIFATLLRNKGLKSPGYREIYISIAENMKQAKKQFAHLYWYKYTYSTLDLEKYLKSDDMEKEKMVIESISSALRYMADFDHLDKNIIEEVIDLVKHRGSDIELVCFEKENENYLAQVVYKVTKDHKFTAEYYLKLTNKKTGKIGTIFIDRLDFWYAPHSLGKLDIKKKKITISGRKSFSAQVSRQLHSLPDKYDFNISDIMK